MKKIYLVMSQTGSILSRTLKVVTGHKYNHISISIDEDLSFMYSFGRKRPYNPFKGVFVVEEINKGTYKRFKNTKCMVISVDVTDYQYDQIKLRLSNMVYNKDMFKYNFMGLLFAIIKVDWHPRNKYYCSEFVRELLDKSSVDVSYIPSIAHPNDFFSISNSSVLYEGFLNQYSFKKCLGR